MTSDRVADPESIAPVSGDAEIALVSHGQFRNVVYSSRNRVRTALHILRVGLSNGRVPQFLPVYSA